MPIENVSDTARWVAVYRAMESERRDAIFHDPFGLRMAAGSAIALTGVLIIALRRNQVMPLLLAIRNRAQ